MSYKYSFRRFKTLCEIYYLKLWNKYYQWKLKDTTPEQKEHMEKEMSKIMDEMGFK